jgi:hypothetical protein
MDTLPLFPVHHLTVVPAAPLVEPEPAEEPSATVTAIPGQLDLFTGEETAA